MEQHRETKQKWNPQTLNKMEQHKETKQNEIAQRNKTKQHKETKQNTFQHNLLPFFIP
jgi:hypothetical protein